MGGGGRGGIGNIRTIAAEHAEADSVDLQQAIWQFVKLLSKAASEGDVAAAHLLLDRLPESHPLGGESAIIQVVAGVARPKSELEQDDEDVDLSALL